MFKNHLKTAFRQLFRHKIIMLINILGLSVGISCFIITSLTLIHELNFDKYHKNSKRIYRLINEFNDEGKQNFYSGCPAPLKNVIDEEISGIERTVRFGVMQSYTIVSLNEKQFHNLNITLTDPEFLKIFDVGFIEGDPNSALSDIHSVVLTKSLALKIFGKTNVVGKYLIITEAKPLEYLVTGIIEDMPENSSISFDCLCPFPKGDDKWSTWNYSTYVLLSKEANIESVTRNLNISLQKYLKDEDVKIHLQPLTKVYLNLDWNSPYPSIKSGQVLYIYGFTGIIILLIACLNYIILTNAYGRKREKEVFVRKCNGAQKSKLIIQFLSESLILIIIATFIAVFITENLFYDINHLNITPSN